jgi:hypothetical protein
MRLRRVRAQQKSFEKLRRLSRARTAAVCKEFAGDLQLRRFGGKTPAMSAPKDDLLQAVELALAGKWDAAHELVQQYDDDASAAWIHAVLHKMEDDLGNACYWYRHADRMDHVVDELVAYKLAGEPFPGSFGIFYKVSKPTKNAKEAEINKSFQSKVTGLKDWQILQKNFDRMK